MTKITSDRKFSNKTLKTIEVPPKICVNFVQNSFDPFATRNITKKIPSKAFQALISCYSMLFVLIRAPKLLLSFAPDFIVGIYSCAKLPCLLLHNRINTINFHYSGEQCEGLEAGKPDNCRPEKLVLLLRVRGERRGFI